MTPRKACGLGAKAKIAGLVGRWQRGRGLMDSCWYGWIFWEEARANRRAFWDQHRGYEIPELMGTTVRVHTSRWYVAGMMLSLLYCTYGFKDQNQMIFDGQGRSEP
ncbi:hypothetical protein CI102_5314 [Trichoderma harzianum]|uniref:Uncharacterized protein n=1 Tax=Trichoderma harzianum CBS 226.95 TaxID=983964 RepID=A0A2T4AUW9_TRIHA|nr:hypothetical protein M431DRAFT_198725 [Trichoderma harzianum CBS 226.95]PKK50579.1 hypothetical protein CI102_5314 [Trichoderma harzianum]PTB60866.1 hypothetical protein M431DRAFT_198725 [Trichoderma harzianum CBS 226.95]